MKVDHWEETEGQATEEPLNFLSITFLSGGKERSPTTSDVIDTACARTLVWNSLV